MCENVENQAENNQFKVIWLDETFSDAQKSIDRSIYTRSITHHLKTFFNIDQCWNYVLDTDVEYLFLIITLYSLSSTNIDIVKKANSLSPIEIYNDQFISLSKVRHISANVEDLFRQLHIDTCHCMENLLSNFNLLEIGKLTQNRSKESGKFIWHQFYLETLFQAFDLEQAKYEMITYCRNY